MYSNFLFISEISQYHRKNKKLSMFNTSIPYLSFCRKLNNIFENKEKHSVSSVSYENRSHLFKISMTSFQLFFKT